MQTRKVAKFFLNSLHSCYFIYKIFISLHFISIKKNKESKKWRTILRENVNIKTGFVSRAVRILFSNFLKNQWIRFFFSKRHILKLIKKRENFKKEFLKLTLETFEKRYKLNDYDGSLTDSIACSLKPLLNNNITSSTINSVSQLQQQIQQQQTQPNTLNNLLNNSNSFTNNKLNSYNSQSNDKNLSSIDKTIKDLISSNKLKQLGSPPHSLKKVRYFFAFSFLLFTNYNCVNCKFEF